MKVWSLLSSGVIQAFDMLFVSLLVEHNLANANEYQLSERVSLQQIMIV